MKSFTVPISVFTSLIMGSTAFANSSLFLETSPLTQREKCEIDRAWPIEVSVKSNLSHCTDVQLFEPIKQIYSDDKIVAQTLKLSPQTSESWPLPELSIKTEQTQGHLNIAEFLLDGVKYDLYEYIPLNEYGYKEIAIGKMHDVIVLQLRHHSIVQLFFVRQPCDDGETVYGIKYAFSWYPPLQGGSYRKAFFKTPLCN